MKPIPTGARGQIFFRVWAMDGEEEIGAGTHVRRS